MNLKVVTLCCVTSAVLLLQPVLCCCQVKKAFLAMVQNGVRAAALWDSIRQDFVGKYSHLSTPRVSGLLFTMGFLGRYWRQLFRECCHH